MSPMGWGKVTPEQWKEAKDATLGSDDVPEGNYVVEIGGYKHFEAAKSAKGLGTHILSTLVAAEGNDPATVGKKLELRFMYHPDPKDDKYRQMNQISLQKAVKLIEACGVEPMTDASGYLDVEGTFKTLKEFKPRVLVTVTKRLDGVKTYQDVENPQAITTA